MTQTWDPLAYAQDGAFVHGLAGGVFEWLARSRENRFSTWAVGTGSLRSGLRLRAHL